MRPRTAEDAGGHYSACVVRLAASAVAVPEMDYAGDSGVCEDCGRPLDGEIFFAMRRSMPIVAKGQRFARSAQMVTRGLCLDVRLVS